VSRRRALSHRLATIVPGESAVITLGLGLTAISLWNFWMEVNTLSSFLGPFFAGIANVGLSLVLVGVGVWLARSPLPDHRRWTIAGWCLLGALVAVSAEAFTVAVRVFEGRTVTEPQFSVIVMSNLGGIFGALVGNYAETAREEGARATQSKDAMAFTNGLLRHDVLNGLQIMRGHAELLEEHDDDRVAESGVALVGQVASLEALINEVRAVSDVLLDEAESEPMDLVPLIDDAVSNAQDSFPAATFETDLPETLVADGTLALKPVFTNLLNNAIQHTGSDVTVRIAGHDADDTVRVVVEDDGPGVPPEERERIFERGVTTDGGDGGLGLHIVATILERSDGSIRVTEGDLDGARFEVTLPAANGEPTNEKTGPFG